MVEFVPLGIEAEIKGCWKRCDVDLFSQMERDWTTNHPIELRRIWDLILYGWQTNIRINNFSELGDLFKLELF